MVTFSTTVANGLFFLEILTYTSSLFLGEKFPPKEGWWQKFLETASVTKYPSLRWSQQVPWASLPTGSFGAVSVLGRR